MRHRAARSIITALALGVSACQSTGPTSEPSTVASVQPSGRAASAAPASPGPGGSGTAAIDPATFTTTIDNPWFPLIPGTVLTYAGTEDEDKLLETFEVTTETKVIAGVTCVVIRDLLKVNGVLEERTDDYYVQDRDGNVWYFGEDTAELDEHGNVISTEGTWHAGVDNARPGIFMPADPRVGDAGEQEHYPGHAEDRFVVLLTDASVKVPAGSYTGALLTLEWTVLEPDVLSEKLYVQGVGEVKEFDVRGGSEVLQLTKVVAPGAG